MGKKRKKENTRTKEENIYGKYETCFKKLRAGERVTLKDHKSDAKTVLPILMTEDAVLTEPDGKLIGNVNQQQKCDFLLRFEKVEQTDFIELKGTNISVKEKYNPYDQIIDTISYMESDEILRNLVIGQEKQAFIVSPCTQKIPSGIETKERQLWQKLVSRSKERKQIHELVHYVRVVPKGRFSCNNGKIVCSAKDPMKLPM